MSGKREREEKLTHEQKTIMVEFMEDHSDFAQNKFLGVEGKKSIQSLWEVLVTQLNNALGPEKSVAKWQKTWTSIKNKTKRKVGLIKCQRDGISPPPGPGGGPGNYILTDLEERVVAIINSETESSLEGPDCTNSEIIQIAEIVMSSGTSGENTPEGSEGISSEIDTGIEENIPTPKRRRKQQPPEKQLNETLKDLVDEVRKGRSERIRAQATTNELLADIALSLRKLSGRTK